MAKTDKIRFHLVLPEEGPDELISGFKNRFSIASGQFSEYVGQFDEVTFLSTEILEDRRNHREDISEIHARTVEAFPDADVLLTEQYSPRNRYDEDFLAYNYDVIIRVCNLDPDAPSITRCIELTDAKVQGSDYLYWDGIYLISTGDDNPVLVALDLNKGVESWRQGIGDDDVPRKLRESYAFEAGILQITNRKDDRKAPTSQTMNNEEDSSAAGQDEEVTASGEERVNTLFFLSWEDGSIEWGREDVAVDGETILTYEPNKTEQALYAGSDEGTLYRLDIADGAVEEITKLSGKIRAIEFDTDSTYVTTATKRQADNGDESILGGARRHYDFSLVALSDGEVRWKADFEGSGLGVPHPHVTGDVVVTEQNDELNAYNREDGSKRWNLTEENLQVGLNLNDGEGSGSELGNFELKILDSIDDTIYCVVKARKGFLVAIDSLTGDTEWVNQEYDVNPHNLGVIHEHGEKLVFNHDDNNFVTSFVALESKSGTEEWRFETPGWTRGDTSTGVGFVFLTSEECIVFDD